MTHPALFRAQQGFDRADAAVREGELAAMLAALEEGLDALCELAHAGVAIPRPPQPAPPPFDAQATEQAVWKLLYRLKETGCGAFPFAGTLLGLERDGRLLPGDKDADFGVWLEDFNLARRALLALGFVAAGNAPRADNVAALVDPRLGLSVDLFGIRRDPVARRLEGGVWHYGRPASWQRVTHYPWFTLAPRPGPFGEVWWPRPADGLLAALYGDWRTPQPHWDSVVSCLAVQETNLHWRAWALKALAARWARGDLAGARNVLEQIAARGGWWQELQRYRAALDKALAA